MVLALGTEPFDIRNGLTDAHAFKTVEFGDMGLKFRVILKGFFISELIILLLEENDSSCIVTNC